MGENPVDDEPTDSFQRENTWGPAVEPRDIRSGFAEGQGYTSET